MKRVYLAGAVFGVALAVAVWLLTYRTWTLFEYIDGRGRRSNGRPRDARRQGIHTNGV